MCQPPEVGNPATTVVALFCPCLFADNHHNNIVGNRTEGEPLKSGLTHEILEELYERYNRPEFIHPDPLEFVYRYESAEDREIAGLIAAVLAYGNVKQIIRSADNALSRMGDSPRDFVERVPEDKFDGYFADFKHRFTDGTQMAELLVGLKRIIARHGSIRQCFESHISPDNETYIPALTGWSDEILADFEGGCSYLLPSPVRGSACKRSNLYLKWMIRKDAVDAGVWEGLSPAKLIVPIDRHMDRICRSIGLTSRKQADLKTAIEVTEGFRAFVPEDPAKYDFAITRLGIRDDCDPSDFIQSCIK